MSSAILYSVMMQYNFLYPDLCCLVLGAVSHCFLMSVEEASLINCWALWQFFR